MDGLIVGVIAARKAMTEVVIPATTESGSSHAIEQAALVNDFLAFLEARLHLADARREYEVRERLRLAGELLADPVVQQLPSTARLRSTRQALMDLVDRPNALPEDVDAAVADVALSVRGTLDDIAQTSDEDRRRVELIILSGSHAINVMERAWSLPLGFDPDPSRAEDLKQLLTAPSTQ